MIATVNCHSRSGLGYNHADGNGTKYEYDAHGRLTKRTWARGIETTYSYDAWGNLVTTAYSDNTPTVTLAYDAMGRRVTKNNQRFIYNGYLQIANYHLSSVDGQLFVWDPTEKDPSRSLVWRKRDTVAYYTHDGNKNVSEVVPAIVTGPLCLEKM